MTLDADKIQSLGPRRVVIDGDLVETHRLGELIAWDKYQKKQGGPSFKKCKRAKFIQPGPNSRFEPPEC